MINTPVTREEIALLLYSSFVEAGFSESESHTYADDISYAIPDKALRDEKSMRHELSDIVKAINYSTSFSL